MRWLVRNKKLLVLALVLAVVAPAYAVLSFTPGTVNPAAIPPLPSNFFMPLTITPGVPATTDLINSVEVGRDDTSPYVAIVVTLGIGNPVIGAMGPWWPTFPPGFQTSVPGYLPPGRSGIILRLIYRPTNDPASQGWVTAGTPPAPLPIVPCQLDEAWQTCAALAAQLDAFRLGTPAPVGVTPFIFLEFNPNGTTTNFLEFYKIQIIR